MPQWGLVPPPLQLTSQNPSHPLHYRHTSFPSRPLSILFLCLSLTHISLIAHEYEKYFDECQYVGYEGDLPPVPISEVETIGELTAGGLGESRARVQRVRTCVPEREWRNAVRQLAMYGSRG